MKTSIKLLNLEIRLLNTKAPFLYLGIKLIYPFWGFWGSWVRIRSTSFGVVLASPQVCLILVITAAGTLGVIETNTSFLEAFSFSSVTDWKDASLILNCTSLSSESLAEIFNWATRSSISEGLIFKLGGVGVFWKLFSCSSSSASSFLAIFSFLAVDWILKLAKTSVIDAISISDGVNPSFTNSLFFRGEIEVFKDWLALSYSLSSDPEIVNVIINK